MMNFVTTILIVIFWRAANEAFEQGATHAGWVLIFISAFNGALLMSNLYEKIS